MIAGGRCTDSLRCRMSWTPARLATEIAMSDDVTGGIAVGDDLRGGSRVTSLVALGARASLGADFVICRGHAATRTLAVLQAQFPDE